MKHLILVLLLITGFSNAQANFEKGMLQAFELWRDNKTDEAENLFERIANAEPKQWLPHYYITQINSLKSWGVKDATVLKAQLDKAQAHLDLALAIEENNPELLIMQALVYTNWIASDGMTYGMKYSGKVNTLYVKALKIAPNNPRVVFSEADWNMNSAKFFGKDTAPYCEAIEKSILLFDTFKAKSKLHPTWGKQRAQQVAASCKN